MRGEIDNPEDGLTENLGEYTCSNCGDVWDYRNSVVTGSIDVSGLEVKRICPSIDSGFVMHVAERLD